MKDINSAALIVPSIRQRLFLIAVLAAGTVAAAFSASAQLLYQEGFNDDGEKANPPRYTTIGREVYERDRQLSELALDSQLGPIYWAHNFEVSFVGVPAPTSGRRALLTWDGAIVETDVNAKCFQLIDSTVKWLVNNKARASIVFTPTIAATQSLADHLASLGYGISDDNETDAETNIVADLIIKGVGNTNPSRFAKSALPVLCYSALDQDDMLNSSIGSVVTFEAGNATVVTASHPAAGGLTGSFPLVAGSHAWQLIGDILPGGSTTIASFIRNIPPSAASLAEVDAMIAGTTATQKATNTYTALDFNDGSAGNWSVDNQVPGGAAGVYGLLATGKLRVTQAGKYSFALGMDDGARLRIDANKDGIKTNDNVIVEDVGGAHRARYGDVTFASAGTYDFEVTMFNSGGSGDLEMSVSIIPGGGDTNAIDGGTWELLGQTSGNVSLEGSITATSFVPTNSATAVVPFIVVLNGPNDTPAGAVFGGGPFSGFEGRGFFAMAAGNKWPYPDTAPIYNSQTMRTLRLKPVDVTGKKNVKLTIALAASFLDFETDDYMVVMADLDGNGPAEPVELGVYSAPTANDKYFVDIKNGNTHRLNLNFQDVTYNIPAAATQLAIELRCKSTWWNEIMGFDNIRITAGDTEPINVVAGRDGNNLKLTWTGGNAPFVVQGKASVNATAWSEVMTTSDRSASIPMNGNGGIYRIQGQ